MTNQFKNPIFWGLILFAGGMTIAAIGWIKNEAIEAYKTHGSTFMIVLGVIMIIAGLIVWATQSNRK